jgi:hypothetical protein
MLTVALIASVESLLSAVAVDRMHTGSPLPPTRHQDAWAGASPRRREVRAAPSPAR